MKHRKKSRWPSAFCWLWLYSCCSCQRFGFVHHLCCYVFEQQSILPLLQILPPTSSTIPLMAKYLLMTFVMNMITIMVSCTQRASSDRSFSAAGYCRYHKCLLSRTCNSHHASMGPNIVFDGWCLLLIMSPAVFMLFTCCNNGLETAGLWLPEATSSCCSTFFELYFSLFYMVF